MTIDEAIAHAREVAESWKLNQEDCYFNTDCNNCAEFCEECAKEHEQLAEWLEELKERRETNFDYVSLMDKRYYEGYNKAIDDFAERIALEISESIIWGILVNSDKDNSFSDTTDKIVDYVIDTSKEIAEQLKKGGAE